MAECAAAGETSWMALHRWHRTRQQVANPSKRRNHHFATHLQRPSLIASLCSTCEPQPHAAPTALPSSPIPLPCSDKSHHLRVPPICSRVRAHKVTPSSARQAGGSKGPVAPFEVRHVLIPADAGDLAPELFRDLVTAILLRLAAARAAWQCWPSLRGADCP